MLLVCLVVSAHSELERPATYMAPHPIHTDFSECCMCILNHQLQKALTCDTCNRLWSYHYHKTNTSSIIWNTDKFSIDFLHGIIHDRTYCLFQNIKCIFSTIYMTNLLNSIFITLQLLSNAINLLGVENTPQP